MAGEIKFINTLKYFQKSLPELASTLSDDLTNIIILTLFGYFLTLTGRKKS